MNLLQKLRDWWSGEPKAPVSPEQVIAAMSEGMLALSLQALNKTRKRMVLFSGRHFVTRKAARLAVLSEIERRKQQEQP